MIIQGSPDILTVGPGLNNQFNGFGRSGLGATLTADVAQDLMYRASTTGVATSEFEQYGGYFAVKEAARAAGLDQTTEAIQSYEIANELPESVSTLVNKQYIGDFGESLFAAQEAALVGGDEALKAQVREKIARDYEIATAAAAATAKAVADAYAAAQAAAQAAALAAAKAKTLAEKQAADALRARALIAVKALYLQILGREGDQAGLDYFADRFGDFIDPDELQVFKDMSKDEIDARNKYLADMAAKSKEDAAKAKIIADGFAATAAKAKQEAHQATGGSGGGINPMLILAAAAAAFFIGG